MDYLVFKDKGLTNLKVAELLLEKHFFDSCANRSYYAMFQIAGALVLKEEHDEKILKSHEGLMSFFAQQYCNRNKVFPAYKNHLYDVLEIRTLSDYKDGYVTKKEAKKAFQKAQEFVNQIISRRLT